MNDRRPARREALRLALPAVVALALAGCGGSISLGFGYDLRDDRPPTASLAVTPESAARGQPVRLVAAASDDHGVDAVEFYRLDAAGATLLGSDTAAPYQLDTSVPSNAAGSVQYFARAIDGANQRGDSAVVTVIVTP